MPKYVFSSRLETATWNNSTIVRGDVCTEVRRLKDQSGGNLLMYGHGLLAETLLKHQLTDAIDVSVHPLLLGRGKLLFRAEQSHAPPDRGQDLCQRHREAHVRTGLC